MSNETNATIDEIMSDIQSFACTWALVGTRLDDGDMYATAEEQSAALRTQITTALDSQARQIEALTAERDELRLSLGESMQAHAETQDRLTAARKPATPAPGEWIQWTGKTPPCSMPGKRMQWMENPDGDITAYRILP